MINCTGRFREINMKSCDITCTLYGIKNSHLDKEWDIIKINYYLIIFYFSYINKLSKSFIARFELFYKCMLYIFATIYW